MRNLKLLSAAAFLFSLAVAPGAAEARNHHRHHWLYGFPYEISYNHNYGHGPLARHLRVLRRPLDQCLRAKRGDVSGPGSPSVSVFPISAQKNKERTISRRE